MSTFLLGWLIGTYASWIFGVAVTAKTLPLGTWCGRMCWEWPWLGDGYSWGFKLGGWKALLLTNLVGAFVWPLHIPHSMVALMDRRRKRAVKRGNWDDGEPGFRRW